MKTLSNDELQDAIMWAVKLIKDDNSKQDAILLVHLENLTDEQRKRATDELTLEPMEPAPGRVDFDARVRGQEPLRNREQGGMDGPEWVGFCDLGRPVPAKHIVDVVFVDGNDDTGTADSFDWSIMGQSNAIDEYRDWTAWEQSK